jgi:hypothetical protein
VETRGSTLQCAFGPGTSRPVRPGPTRPYSSFFELVKHFSKIVKWVAANGSGAHIAGRAIAATVFAGKLLIFEGLQQGLVACTAPSCAREQVALPRMRRRNYRPNRAAENILLRNLALATAMQIDPAGGRIDRGACRTRRARLSRDKGHLCVESGHRVGARCTLSIVQGDGRHFESIGCLGVPGAFQATDEIEFVRVDILTAPIDYRLTG